MKEIMRSASPSSDQLPRGTPQTLLILWMVKKGRGLWSTAMDRARFGAPRLMGPITLSFLIMIMLFMAGAAWACPMCKEVAANQSDPTAAEHLRGGFAVSLGLLLSTPYLLFGGITLLVARSARRKNAS